MKRIELIRRIETAGCVLIRHGGKHDWYQNPKTKICQAVPRHTEIKEYLTKTKSILRKLQDDAS